MDRLVTHSYFIASMRSLHYAMATDDRDMYAGAL